jgi:hypothetical protein
VKPFGEGDKAITAPTTARMRAWEFGQQTLTGSLSLAWVHEFGPQR